MDLTVTIITHTYDWDLRLNFFRDEVRYVEARPLLICAVGGARTHTPSRISAPKTDAATITPLPLNTGLF